MTLLQLLLTGAVLTAFPSVDTLPPAQGLRPATVVRTLWGQPAPDPSFHLGLWAYHLQHPAWGVSQHSLLGATWRGYFGGTFINTYGNRTYAAGVRRIVVGREDRSSRIHFGYRLGLLAGYDERLVPLAGRLPAIPALELVGGTRLGPLGLHWSWAGVVTQVSTVWYWPRRKKR